MQLIVVNGVPVYEMGIRTRKLWRATAIALLAQVLTLGQSASVPANFRETYASLEAKIDGFNRTVSAQWNGQKSPVVWSTELLIANCNRGLKLLRPQAHQNILLELDRLQGLGVKAVTFCIGFPILYQPFYGFNGDPQDYQPMVAFYRGLVTDIHKRGMKAIVESSLLFLGDYSAGSGFNLAEYYPTLRGRQLVDGRAQNIVTIAKEVRPDFLNLGSEPDTQAYLSKQPFLKTPKGYSEVISDFLKELRQAGAADIPIGAGIGTWQRDGKAFVQALLSTGINYLDLHIYPVNHAYLENAVTYADMAHAAGKQVAISEAWLLKVADTELATINVAGDSTAYSRDAYSFWAPLDQKFLSTLIKYANWKSLLYCSFYWSRYFWSYVSYDQVQHFATARQTIQQSVLASMNAMRDGKLTPTAEFYRKAITGK